MSGRRVLLLYAMLLLSFVIVLCRLFWLSSNPTYAARAEAQSTVQLELPARRGNFYDYDGLPLTGLGERWFALCIPGQGNYTKLYPLAGAAEQAKLYQKRNASGPFLLEVGQDLAWIGVPCYSVPRRYGSAPLAPALLGYLDGEGHGVAGLEAAFDTVLSGNNAADTIRCAVTAQGTLRSGTVPERVRAESSAAGVQLTLSRSVQRAVEAAAGNMMQKGGVLVLETKNANVRACVSLPTFDPENVSVSLDAPDSPLLNRAFASYAVGSVFKPVLAAAALEAGEVGLVIDCPGYCIVDGQIFRCAGGIAHGTVDLAAALQKSCNGYFIQLGQNLGPERVWKMAEQFGFGRALCLTDTERTASGLLPEWETLTSTGAFANFCFGQGELLATPVQIAGMMNTIAGDGCYREPLFVEGTLDETTGEPLTTLSHRRAKRILTPQTAEKLRTLLTSVVTEGTGQEAAPQEGEETAGGKTGTAQTGQFVEGKEQKNFWFAGFWPAEDPRYTIVVMQDGLTEPVHSSAAVFARICEALAVLNFPYDTACNF